MVFWRSELFVYSVLTAILLYGLPGSFRFTWTFHLTCEGMIFGLFIALSALAIAANVTTRRPEDGHLTVAHVRPPAWLRNASSIHQMAGSCGNFFRPKKNISYSSPFTAMLLILGGVEPNPGPSIKIGSLNARSIVNKGPLVMDLIREHRLDALAICESWVVDDDPECIKAGSVPQGYMISHIPRPSATLRSRGGGLCFICRTNIDINRHPLQNSFNAKSFECQLLKIKLGHGGSTDGVTLMNIYRPPSHSLKDFCDELSDLLSRLSDVIDEDRLVVCGEFNCGGEDSSSIGLDLQNILDIHAMQQFVTTATRLQEAGSGRLLDLVIARAGSTRISQLSVHPTHDISDHHLVTWSLATRMLPPRKLITFFHRNLKGIDKKKFQDDILASAVYSDPADTVDGFTEQLEQTVGDILERHCPLRKRTKFASARRDGHWLSDDAISAKRERRKLERKWKKSGDEQDRIKYRKHCRVTNRKILGARQEVLPGSHRRSWKGSSSTLVGHQRCPSRHLWDQGDVRGRMPQDESRVCGLLRRQSSESEMRHHWQGQSLIRGRTGSALQRQTAHRCCLQRHHSTYRRWG